MDLISQRLVGNTHSKEAHRPNCWWAGRIKRRRGFDSLKDAVFQGYDACGNCLKRYNHVVHTGFLVLHQPFPDVKGEFILPNTSLTFSKSKTAGGESFQIVINLNEKRFEMVFLDQEKTADLKLDKVAAGISPEEEVVLKKFGAMLARDFAGAQPAEQLYRKILIMMLSLIAGKTESFRIKRTKKSLIKSASTKQVLTKGKSDWLNKTVFDFLDVQDKSGYKQARRLSPCIFKGEAVQAVWKDENDAEKREWGIVAGPYGNDDFGCVGTPDLFGSMDAFLGWAYFAADHDMCQDREDHHCLQECKEEFWLALLLTLLTVPVYCTGNNPPASLCLSPQEIEQGYYTFTEQHPMAGRKIGTPLDWTVRFDDETQALRWQGEPLPPQAVEAISAEPHSVTFETGTNIKFKLSRNATAVVINLYSTGMTDAIQPIVTLTKHNLSAGENQIYWNGVDSNQARPDSAWFAAEFVVDGIKFKMVNNIFFYEKTTVATTDDLLKDITISPNPFSIKKTPTINFSVTKNVPVEAYILHINWEKLQTVKLKIDLEGDTELKGTIKWNCRNWATGVAPNGEYKIKFYVDGKPKIIGGLHKVDPQHEGATTENATILDKVVVSPSEFSIEKKPRISFRLKAPATVSLYVYHARLNTPVKRILHRQPMAATTHTRTWNCLNDYGVQAVNGQYRLCFIVDESESWVEGLNKKSPWQI